MTFTDVTDTWRANAPALVQSWNPNQRWYSSKAAGRTYLVSHTAEGTWHASWSKRKDARTPRDEPYGGVVVGRDFATKEEAFAACEADRRKGMQ